jgi:hypothetical protein
MPYHAAAIGTKWSDVAPSYRILIHSLMKAAGAGFLGSAIAGAFVLFVPFRAGAGWARWEFLSRPDCRDPYAICEPDREMEHASVSTLDRSSCGSHFGRCRLSSVKRTSTARHAKVVLSI